MTGQPPRDPIERCLDRLGRTEPPTSCVELGAGYSGTLVYRLTYAASPPDVLKVAGAASSPLARQRARRELAFYQTLARQVPLAVPRVLASLEDDSLGTCLLLAAASPLEPPADGGDALLAKVGDDLARLHLAFQGRAQSLARLGWLRPLELRTSAHDLAQADDAWQTLRAIGRFADVLTVRQHHRLLSLLCRIEALDGVLARQPVTLCHGDCHAGNLLRDVQGRLL